MIAYLSGTIQSLGINNVIVNVNGIGYELRLPVFALEDCHTGDQKEFYVYTHVRQDILELYGFIKKEDKQIFLQLLTVSSIGPKSALNIISYSGGANNIINAIQNADVEFFSSIKGIGKKSSQRIIVDLKSKIGGLKDLQFDNEADKELIEALKGLGFVNEEIKKAIKDIPKGLSLENKIRQALKNNGNRR